MNSVSLYPGILDQIFSLSFDMTACSAACERKTPSKMNGMPAARKMKNNKHTPEQQIPTLSLFDALPEREDEGLALTTEALF